VGGRICHPTTKPTYLRYTTLGDEFPEGVATRASIYVYVEDADAAYARALGNGATSISPPEDKPYGERAGGVRDSFGNVWYISTYLGGE
jgi:uncharacterized glyoxalase superfamily protein PhnB